MQRLPWSVAWEEDTDRDVDAYTKTDTSTETTADAEEACCCLCLVRKLFCSRRRQRGYQTDATNHTYVGSLPPSKSWLVEVNVGSDSYVDKDAITEQLTSTFTCLDVSPMTRLSGSSTVDVVEVQDLYTFTVFKAFLVVRLFLSVNAGVDSDAFQVTTTNAVVHVDEVIAN